MMLVIKLFKTKVTDIRIIKQNFGFQAFIIT